MYDWSIKLEGSSTMMFKLEFNQPEFISSTGVDHDQLKIFFVDSSAFIQCLGPTKRRTLKIDSPLSLPPMTVIKFDLPPQILKEETEQDLDVTGLLLLGIAVSVLIGVPSEIVYDGILSAQIISHMPLNNVNLP